MLWTTPVTQTSLIKAASHRATSSEPTQIVNELTATFGGYLDELGIFVICEENGFIFQVLSKETIGLTSRRLSSDDKIYAIIVKPSVS